MQGGEGQCTSPNIVTGIPVRNLRLRGKEVSPPHKPEDARENGSTLCSET